MGNQLSEALKASGLIGSKKDSPAKKSREVSRSDAISSNKKSPAQRPIQISIPFTWDREDKGGSIVAVPIQPLRPKVINDLAGTKVKLPSTYKSASTAERASITKESSNRAISDFLLENIEEFQPHHLFRIQPVDQAEVVEPTSFGIHRQLSVNPQDATDLIIGLDFGTSATKVVIRDVYARNVFPVEFNPDTVGLERFLQASCIRFCDGIFTLSGKGEQLNDLKLALLDCKAAFPVTEFNRCCAFLALTIRKARGWFFSTHEAVYRNHQLNWFINVGLAARSYQDDGKVHLFRRLAWAASNLAADSRFPHISEEAVDKYRELSLIAFSNNVPIEISGMEFAPIDVGVIPEVAAQIQGFMTSARWDWKNRPIMMLVDVGAGTVDTALFHVNPSDKKLTFYSSRVESFGAMNLHRERVSWLVKGIPKAIEFTRVHDYLQSIALPTGRVKAIPSEVEEYLPGYCIHIKKNNIDKDFQVYKYRAQVAGSINDAKLYKGVGTKGSQQLIGIPLLLCGGGSRLPIYSTIQNQINGSLGLNVSVEKTLMPVPIELKDNGWRLEEFDRISVAYGLSLQQGLEKIVRAVEVPDIARSKVSEASERYVSKDQC